MCGIAGFYAIEDTSWDLPLEKLVNQLLDRIEFRGRDATGVLSVPSDGTDFRLERAPVDATTFIKYRRGLVPNPRMVLCHTRATTKGNEHNISNNHPVVYGNTFITHNGHISNDDKIFEDEKLDRHAEVDSEAIAAVLSKYGLEKANVALKKLSGGFAVAAVDMSSPDTLLLAKGNSSPLFYHEYSNLLVWASTEYSLKEACEKTFTGNKRLQSVEELKPGELLLVTQKEGVKKFNFDLHYTPMTRPAARSQQTIPPKVYDPRSQPSSVHMQNLCKCVHTRFWHQGVPGSNGCTVPGCECEKFEYNMSGVNMNILEKGREKLLELEKEEKEKPKRFAVYQGEETRWYVVCEWCEHGVPEDDTSIHYGYTVCPRCAKELLSHIGSGGSDRVSEDLDDDDEDEFEEPKKTILEAIALEQGFTLKYVNWLLFIADDDDFNSNTHTNDYIVCDEAWRRISARYGHDDSLVEDDPAETGKDTYVGPKVFKDEE